MPHTEIDQWLATSEKVLNEYDLAVAARNARLSIDTPTRDIAAALQADYDTNLRPTNPEPFSWAQAVGKTIDRDVSLGWER